MQNVAADHRGKIYRRTVDGVESFVTVKEALAEVNDAMIGRVARERSTRTMSSSRGQHDITYRDGRRVVLIEIDAPAPVEAASDGRRIVTVKGKRYVVGAVVPEQTERRQISKHSYSLPHPAYVRYWSAGPTGLPSGPTRDCSGRSKPGTVGHAIWNAIQ